MRRGAFFLAAAAALAQSGPAFHSNVELVAIPCVVVDPRGAPVDGLAREDFRVYDNGRRRIVEQFWLDADMPLTLGIVIDASDSQREQIAEHRQRALKLLESVMRPGDRAFVVSVDQEIRLAADLAATPEEVRRRMNAGSGPLLGEQCAAAACGASPLWNAVYETARLKMEPLAGRKALLLLTDGFDSGSSRTWRQAADQAARAGTQVYAVQYRSSSGAGYAPDLYRLVEEAGGAWFGPPQESSASQESGAIADRLEADLRRGYVLGVQPERLSGRLRHELRVEVSRPDLTVRSRKVYFQPR